jgi:hypothetical protein
LCLFSACIKTYKLVPPETPQGKKLKDAKKISEECVRSAKVYDEWETSAGFDVLWLSDDARSSYTEKYCSRRGKSEAERQSMLSKESQKNINKTTFYVLADVRDRLHPDMSDKKAAWTMYLEVDGKRIAPEKDSVKEVELAPELREFFGYRYKKPKFKTSYVVTFATTIEKNKPFKMILSSVSRQCELGWQGGEPVTIRCLAGKIGKCKDGKFQRSEDYYW